MALSPTRMCFQFAPSSPGSYMSISCVTCSLLPLRCPGPQQGRSREGVQRPLVQEARQNPKKPWTGELENTPWKAFSACFFQEEFVFGLKEFIQVFTNTQAPHQLESGSPSVRINCRAGDWHVPTGEYTDESGVIRWHAFKGDERPKTSSKT